MVVDVARLHLNDTVITELLLVALLLYPGLGLILGAYKLRGTHSKGQRERSHPVS